MKNFKSLVLAIVIAVIAISFNINAVAMENTASPEADKLFQEMERIMIQHKMKPQYCGFSKKMLDSMIYVTELNDFNSETSNQSNMTGTKPFMRLRNFLILFSSDPTVTLNGVQYGDYKGFTMRTPGHPAVGYLFSHSSGELHIKYMVNNGEPIPVRTQIESAMSGATLKNGVETFLRNTQKK